MEPLKQVQVEGQLMFAEPQDLFGNLDEVCSVRHACNSTQVDVNEAYSVYCVWRLG